MATRFLGKDRVLRTRTANVQKGLILVRIQTPEGLRTWRKLSRSTFEQQVRFEN